MTLTDDEITISKMAHSLLINKIDLGDERAVIRWLMANGYGMGDTVAYSDKAIKVARTQQI